MNITILGGGNIGMCLVGEISRYKKYDVTIFASHPEQFGKTIQVTDDEKEITYTSGEFKATDNIETAISGADVILCTLPAFLRQDIIKKMTPYIKSDAFLGFFPGYGGAEFFCSELIEKGVTVFALQKVPYVARTKERGKHAGLMSKKHNILVSSIPRSNSQRVASMLEDMLLMKVDVLDNYMSATLLPGNPLLHTSGSYVYLKDYTPDKSFEAQIYYYQSWDDECSDVICSFSNEMREICNRLPIDLSGVQTIQEYYESPTPEALTKKFHSIPSFYPLTLPMIKTDKGFLPDFSSRFYTEDIPFGVCIIKALALMVKLETPTIDKILDWYYRMTGKEYFLSDGSFGKDINETAIPQLFGIDTPEKIKNFYLR
ncbi:MAG: NAD/NADP octopine/nopaline dehydrogenase family protein [Ruminococcus sp.]|nr:NAD/NADP octopine/nopaline dehydrogenase family protein [Ruminococcus sp.]